MALPLNIHGQDLPPAWLAALLGQQPQPAPPVAPMLAPGITPFASPAQGGPVVPPQAANSNPILAAAQAAQAPQGAPQQAAPQAPLAPQPTAPPVQPSPQAQTGGGPQGFLSGAYSWLPNKGLLGMAKRAIGSDTAVDFEKDIKAAQASGLNPAQALSKVFTDHPGYMTELPPEVMSNSAALAQMALKHYDVKTLRTASGEDVLQTVDTYSGQPVGKPYSPDAAGTLHFGYKGEVSYVPNGPDGQPLLDASGTPIVKTVGAAAGAKNHEVHTVNGQVIDFTRNADGTLGNAQVLGSAINPDQAASVATGQQNAERSDATALLPALGAGVPTKGNAKLTAAAKYWGLDPNDPQLAEKAQAIQNNQTKGTGTAGLTVGSGDNAVTLGGGKTRPAPMAAPAITTPVQTGTVTGKAPSTSKKPASVAPAATTPLAPVGSNLAPAPVTPTTAPTPQNHKFQIWSEKTGEPYFSNDGQTWFNSQGQPYVPPSGQ